MLEEFFKLENSRGNSQKDLASISKISSSNGSLDDPTPAASFNQCVSEKHRNGSWNMTFFDHLLKRSTEQYFICNITISGQNLKSLRNTSQRGISQPSEVYRNVNHAHLIFELFGKLSIELEALQSKCLCQAIITFFPEISLSFSEENILISAQNSCRNVCAASALEANKDMPSKTSYRLSRWG